MPALPPLHRWDAKASLRDVDARVLAGLLQKQSQNVPLSIAEQFLLRNLQHELTQQQQQRGPT